MNNPKKHIKSKLRKLASVCLSLLFVPFFVFSVHADEMHQIGTPFYRRDGQSSLSVYLSNNTWKNYGMSTKVDDFNGKWTLGNDSGKRFKVYFDPDGWTIPYFENYDYYLNVTLTNMTSQIKINDIAVIRKSSAGTEVNMSISDKTYGVSTYGNNMGYYVTCKLNALDVNSTIGSLNLVFDNTYSIGNSVRICYIVYAVPKSAGATSSDISALIQAINSQTTTLNGSIGGVNSSIQSGTATLDGTLQEGNDLMENGNSDTQSTVSDFNEVFEDFNEELDNIEQFDELILDEFNSANENYLNELDNFELSSSLLNAGNWLSISMQTVYDNSSDFKMLWLVPLLFGIPVLILFVKKENNSE